MDDRPPNKRVHDEITKDESDEDRQPVAKRKSTNGTLDSFFALTQPLGLNPQKRFRIAIIGTAGRGSSSAKMTSALFDAMVVKAKEYVETTCQFNWSNIDLVSGGAAWSDHVAVTLFNQHKEQGTRLTLYLPCELNVKLGKPAQFADNGSSDWRKNPGRSANGYHRQFSTVTGKNSIQELADAREKDGAILDTSEFGFHKRNQQVAKVDRMLAFTWNTGDVPEPGGTYHTWVCCKSQKTHVGLSTLL
jgi:hypothetical protein